MSKFPVPAGSWIKKRLTGCSYVFTYTGNGSLKGFLQAIVIFMETGFAVTALIAMLLNATLPEELEDDFIEGEEESVGSPSQEQDRNVSTKEGPADSSTEKRLS